MSPDPPNEDMAFANNEEENAILDGCSTAGYKWNGWDGVEISGQGYARVAKCHICVKISESRVKSVGDHTVM